ncbi:lysoplasmalogenase [Photobacterium swingsii]|uniref:Lysoplasmalogenase n=1 Tax=Photobacterium swingsii TaxID=680026 RepID=A0A2T3P5B0_9GAMM|nr:lysoplasmalogenase [Photobacterium swingsii]PSW23712.1 lysoplasmalogenase [Photobacterium swingsii]
MWVWLAISFSALLHINAAYTGPKWQFYLFKPLTTGLLMAALWQHGLTHFYQQAIFVGLLCSVVGDIFLMLPRDRFIQGLGGFLVAHILYSIAFWSQLSASMVWWLPAMLFGGGIIVFLLLLPTLGRFTLPVALYIGMITQMAWAAGEFWLTTQSVMALFAFGGAVIFMVSDTILAIDRFKGPYHSSPATIMTTYYLAQSLIVVSALMMPL